MACLEMALSLLLLNLRLVLSQQYQLIQEYNASNIFEDFDFFTDADPTGGYVQYVPFETAASSNLIGNGSDFIYLGVDKTNVYTPGGPGRPSIRLESKMTFTEGIFVIDLTHMPAGCGVWPAFWTAGLGDWPADGEIDIIENVNDARINNVALHATGECFVTETTNQTGVSTSTDCNIAHDENQGCSTALTEPFNYGAEFNANGGGVYAMEWANNAVRVWFFPPMGVPESLLDDYNGIPDPEGFGIPSASFAGPCSGSFGDKFFNHSIIIDTTFCGGWGGGTFGAGSSACPITEGTTPIDSCISYVAANPQAFEEAYWGIKSIRVWEKVPGYRPDTYQNQPTGVLLPAPVTRPFPGTSEPTASNVSLPSVDVSPPIFEAPIASEDTDTTITSTVLSTTTSTLFPDVTLKPLAEDGLPLTGAALTVDDDFVEPATVTTSIPDNALPALESLLAKVTVSVPVSVSPLTGGALVLGNSSSKSVTEPPVVPEMPDPEYGEGTFPDWKEDPYVDPPKNPGGESTDTPSIDPVIIIPPMVPLPIDPGIGDGALPGTCKSVPNQPFPCKPIATEAASPETDELSSISPPFGSWTTEDRPPNFPPALSLPNPKPPKPEPPAPNGNTGIVPSELSDNPPPASIWGAIDDELQDQLLALAASLPAAVAPVVEKVTDAVSDLPLMPSLEKEDTSQAMSGLLGFLDEKTKSQLLGLLGGGDATEPTRQEVARGDASAKQEHVNDVFSNDPNHSAVLIDKSALLTTPPTEDPKLSTTPLIADPAQMNTPSIAEAVSPVLAELPLTSPLNTSDTSRAVGGLFNLLDEATKNQLLSLLLPAVEPTVEPSREADDPRTQYGHNPLWLLGTDALPPAEADYIPAESASADVDAIGEDSWGAVADTLSQDTKAKLNDLILRLAGLDDASIASLSENSVSGLLAGQFLPIIDQINAIGDDEKAKILPWLTGGDGSLLDANHLMVLLESGNSLSLQAGLQDIVNQARVYADIPEDERNESGRAAVMSALKEVLVAINSGKVSEPVNFSEPSREEEPSAPPTAPKFRRRGNIPKLDLISFVEKYQECFQWITRKTPNMTRAQQEELVALCYHHHLNRQEKQPTMDSLEEHLTHGTGFDDVDGSELAGLLDIFSNPNLDSDTKNGLIQQMLEKSDNAVKSFIMQSYLQFNNVLYTLSTDEQKQFLGQLGDGPASYERLRARQLRNLTEPTDDDEQGFLEQQIYAICPTLSTVHGFPLGELIADLEAGINSTLETALLRFRAKLEAYTAKLKQCSSRVQGYAEALKSFLNEKESNEQAGYPAPPTLRARQVPSISGDIGTSHEELPTIDTVIQNMNEAQLAALYSLLLNSNEPQPVEDKAYFTSEDAGTQELKLESAKGLPENLAEATEAVVYKLKLLNRIQGSAQWDTKPKSKRQAPHSLTGNPGFDAYLQHKHRGTIGKWTFGILSKKQRNDLHTFILQAMRCALGNPKLENPAQDDRKCLEKVTTAYGKIKHWINKDAPRGPLPSPQLQNHTGTDSAASDIESPLDHSFDADDLDIFAADTVSDLVAAKQPNKNFYELIDPKWVDRIRDLIFKASSRSKIPFPGLFVKLLRKSLRKHWKHMSKDVQKGILAITEQPLPTANIVARVDGRESLIKALFGLRTAPAKESTGEPLAIKKKLPPILILHPQPPTENDVTSKGTPEELPGTDDYSPWSFDDLPTSSEITPLSGEHSATPKSQSHGYIGALTPGGVLGNDVEDAEINTGFDDLVDSSESKSAPGFELEGKGESDPFGIAESRPAGEEDGADGDESSDDEAEAVEDVYDDAKPEPRLVEEPYSDDDNEDQDPIEDHFDDAYDIDNYMHDLFPEEVEIPSHADENAIAEGRREGYVDALEENGITLEELNEVWGDVEDE